MTVPPSLAPEAAPSSFAAVFSRWHGRYHHLFGGLIWVAMANLLPLLAGVVVLPLLIAALGIKLFGVLTIIWMFVGYFSLFDFGLGRALTFTIARNVAQGGSSSALAATYSTGLTFVTLLGLSAGALFFALSGILTQKVLRLGPDIAEISISAFQVSAAAVVFTVIASAQRGVMEGLGAFRQASIGRMFVGVFLVAGPLLFFYASHNFAVAITAVVVARGALVVYYALSIRSRIIFDPASVSLAHARLLMQFGGWMTVSNIVSPLMTYFDRVFISAWLGISQVSYYTTPFEVISKLLIVPATIGTVVFPRMTASAHADQDAQARHLSFYSYVVNFLLLAPVPVILFFFGQRILSLWIGPAFAARSAAVACILALGCVINAVASVPYNRLQSQGHSRVTGLIHLCEAAGYIAVLVLALSRLKIGIEGVAWIWTLRVTLDWLIMELFSRRGRIG